MTAPTILDAPQANAKYKPNLERKRGEARRIELLGVLNEKHNEALVAGDKGALLEIAAEYALLGCVQMANSITIESENL